MKIHIHSRKGIYNLVSFDEYTLYLSTNRYEFTTPVEDYKCLAGGKWNKMMNVKKYNAFMNLLNKKGRRVERECTLMVKKGHTILVDKRTGETLISRYLLIQALLNTVGLSVGYSSGLRIRHKHMPLTFILSGILNNEESLRKCADSLLLSVPKETALYLMTNCERE
jgi:hypothetical protein